jgi:hypothetical protein
MTAASAPAVEMQDEAIGQAGVVEKVASWS